MTIGGYNVDRHLEAGAHKIKKSSWNGQYRVHCPPIFDKFNFLIENEAFFNNDKIIKKF